MAQVEAPPGRQGTSEGDLSEQIVKAGTYRSLGEQRLSPAEERFEKARRTIGLFLAPAVIVLFLLLPLDMDPTQQRLAAILLGVVVLWITEAVPIPVGGLIGIALIIIFGTLLQETGLAETIGTSSADAFGVTSAASITIFAIVLAIVISETTSNTASASIVVPIVIPIAVAANVDPFVPALAATFAASFGFMLPVSTPQNAIVYGSGVVPITQMVRNGISFDVVGALLILAGVPLMVSILGVGG
jgi:di/tricarboxylate transporter